MKINVLGTEYMVETSNANADGALETLGGYCDRTVKKCVINDYSAEKPDELSVADIGEVIKRNARHELVHAFLSESGLEDSCEWAMNEEMVDWIANQGLKIYKAWQDAGAV